MSDLFPTEAPQYSNLATAITSVWGATQRAVRDLRKQWFSVLGLEDPGKQSARQAALLQAGAKAGRLSRIARRKDLTDAQKAALDEAAEEFLRRYAGEDRTATGFVDPDSTATVQQSEFLSYTVGVARGKEQTGGQDVQLTADTKANLLQDAFARLSEDGRLRFESKLDEIKQGMLDAFDRGDNPLDVARQLAADLDGYERGRLETITRTEMGLASEKGIRDQYRASGITKAEVIGDPTTDEACTDHIGQQYDLEDEENLPIYHPNCLCSTVPVVEES